MEATGVQNQSGMANRSGWRVESKTGGVDIFSDILGAYKRLPMYPFPMFVLALALIVGVAEIYGGEEKPVEVMLKGIAVDLENENVPEWERKALRFIKVVLEFIVNHKVKVFGFLMISFPVLCRPSKNNIYIWVVLVAMCITMRNWGFLEYIVIGNMFYVYTQLLSLTNKFIIILIIVFAVLWNYIPNTRVDSSKVKPSQAPSPPAATPGRKGV